MNRNMKASTELGPAIVGSTQYGSTDRTPSPTGPTTTTTTPEATARNPLAGENFVIEQPASSISGPVPPKPAIRQRIQQQQQQTTISAINRSADLQSSTENGAAPTANQRQDQQQQQPLVPAGEGPTISGHQLILPESDQELVELSHRQQPRSPAVGPKTSFNVVRTAGPKGGLTLPLPTELAPEKTRPYPRKVLFIVANEFCERFSYYGLRTVLVLYFKSVLGFTDANSTVSFHLFATLCYLTPILGAILGDSIWGKFRTILYLSIIYFLGELGLVISSIFWDKGGLSVFATFFGLFLIGVGTGGIKPCVSALGGDQFLPHETKWRQGFFSLFYGAINLGSLISMFLTPMLRSDFYCVNRADCYPLAFGLPCALMLVSIFVFLMAKNQYNLVPLPEKNIIVAFCQCVWLALKRRLSGGGDKLPSASSTIRIAPSISDHSSSSSLSVSSNEEALVNKHQPLGQVVVDKRLAPTRPTMNRPRGNTTTTNNNNESSGNHNDNEDHHWLYLASDQFDSRSIEEFRSVLSIMLLFVPLPVYWCLFDQQGSLWTLQATRMDGRIFNTGFVLQPDQMSVANPLLLLLSIPLFEWVIYPSLTRCNLLTRPLQRITAGGLLAALTFVLSALIEIRIQQFLPPVQPAAGMASLLVVNGLSECSMVSPTISYVPIPGGLPGALLPNNTNQQAFQFVRPLGSQRLDVLSANESSLNNYQLKFKLSSSTSALDNNQSQANNNSNGNGTSTTAAATKNIGCPFDPRVEYDFSVGPLVDKSVKLMYIEQGNGKLMYKIFNESLELPPPGKARVRLLYESFGSSAQASQRQFYLEHISISSSKDKTSSFFKSLQFNTTARDGQVFISDYMDVPVSATGDKFILRTSDGLLGPRSSSNSSNGGGGGGGGQVVYLEPGSRSLIIVHQKDASSVEIKHELLQDNNYRISLLYQLAPYLLISLSEVMFSITGLEFSYAMAPDNMKSVILAAWALTTALGNILTVAVESMHIFSSIVHDFLFYATLMTLDMFVFAIMGYYYRPYKARSSD